MRSKTLFVVALGLLVIGGPPGMEAQEGFKVIVNDANSTSSITQAQLSKIFLKQETNWGNGLRTQPVDLVVSSSVRQSFSLSVLGRDVPAVKNYWQRMIFSGRSVPPPEKSSEAEVLTFVRSNAGAVGYVAASTSVGSGVKVLRMVD